MGVTCGFGDMGVHLSTTVYKNKFIHVLPVQHPFYI